MNSEDLVNRENSNQGISPFNYIKLITIPEIFGKIVLTSERTNLKNSTEANKIERFPFNDGQLKDPQR